MMRRMFGAVAGLLAIVQLPALGAPNIKTPHFDRMAEEGVRFTSAYVGSPVMRIRCAAQK